ncbi:MAG: hypothetical protein L0Z53_28420 [Acidobacteriales bacterium]|nr:hypothetical protein [Terriglobales bacterium]
MIPSDYLVIAGAGVVIILALIAGAWLWNRFQPTSSSTPQARNAPPPCRIALVAEEHPHWKGEKFMTRYMEHFRALGFQLLGAYRIAELDSQRILALMHPTQKFYACVYDSKTHPTFEIFAQFASDNELMGTNSSWVRNIEQRPGCVLERMANATPAQVFEVLRTHEKAGDRIALTADGFVPAFIKAYIQNFNWRLKKCEISRDQIRMDARQQGRALTPQEIDELYYLGRAAYVSQVQDACRAQYRDEKKLAGSEWERLQNRAVAVPETYDLKEVINAISYAVPSSLKEQQMFALQRLETSLGDDGIVLINNIITKNIGELNLKQIGEVKEPVRAWIIVARDPNEKAAEPEEVELPAPIEEKAAA